MPAEKINDTQSPYHRAQVHWSHDQYVQVSTIWADPAKAETDWQGVYVTLDRSGANRLIRALRKARDQAYGTDA